MGKPQAILRVIDPVIWLAAGVGLLLYLSNRIIFHWSNNATKNATTVLLSVGMFLLARLAMANQRRALWRVAPVVLLCSFTVGELHRVWLRQKYRGHAEDVGEVAAINWQRPWTTTDLVVRRHAVNLPQEMGHLRIVHLTDLHITPSIPWAYFQSIVERTNVEAPDVVVMTGDFLSKASYLPLLRRWLALPLRARLGVYAVLGNHEYWAGADREVRQALTLANVRVLSGTCQRLSGGGADHVVLCGTEWPWGKDFDVPPLTAGDFVVALSHTPDNIYALRGRAHAVFAGHNHGGQWRIPGIGALAVPSVYGRRFDLGDFFVDGTELFVSAGVGADYPPLRLSCSPELLLVDFVAHPIAGVAVAKGLEGDRALGFLN